MIKLKTKILKKLYSFPLRDAGQARTFPGDWGRFKEKNRTGKNERIHKIFYGFKKKLRSLQNY